PSVRAWHHYATRMLAERSGYLQCPHLEPAVEAGSCEEAKCCRRFSRRPRPRLTLTTSTSCWYFATHGCLHWHNNRGASRGGPSWTRTCSRRHATSPLSPAKANW